MIRDESVGHRVHADLHLLEFQAPGIPNAMMVVAPGNATGILGELLRGLHQQTPKKPATKEEKHNKIGEDQNENEEHALRGGLDARKQYR